MAHSVTRLMARRAPGPNLMHLLDAMLCRLHAAGFTDDDAALATLLIANYVQGYVLQEQQPKAPAPASGGDEKSSASAEACRGIADTYPNIAGLMAMMAGGDTHKLFEFGVERIIDGLRTRLPGEAGS
jgi:TetR/AcrR family tetracycline transcriptional repressor